MVKGQGKQGKCVMTPFIFVTILCVILGFILLVVPLFTFESDYYIKNNHFSSRIQFVAPQIHSYDTIVFEASEKTNTGIYIFPKGYEKKLTATEIFSVQSRTISASLGTGDAAVIDFYYMNQSQMKVDASGGDGCIFEFNLKDFSEYAEYKPTGKVVVISDELSKSPEVQNHNSLGSVTYHMTHNYTSYGMNYAVLVNKGKKKDVKFSVVVYSPLYNFSSKDALYYCVNESSCKFERLPRGFFALGDISVKEQGKANTVSVCEQYNDYFRWAFPTAIYLLLFFIVLITGIVQCICDRRKPRTVGSYSSIEDPIN